MTMVRLLVMWAILKAKRMVAYTFHPSERRITLCPDLSDRSLAELQDLRNKLLQVNVRCLEAAAAVARGDHVGAESLLERLEAELRVALQKNVRLHAEIGLLKGPRQPRHT